MLNLKMGLWMVRKYLWCAKIYDSIIILTDILNVVLRRLWNNMEYILVYNEFVNAGKKDILEKRKAAVQHSRSFDYFAKHVIRRTGEENICFSIRIFENYCFSKVHIYIKKEFAEYLGRK